MTPSGATVLCFGPFTLDLAAARLRRQGTEVALRPKAYELLVVLARRPHELVTKEELLDSVWGRRFITEGVIKSTVSELRQALGDDPKAPRWIETVARRGYRFSGAAPGAPAPATAANPEPAPAAWTTPGNVPAPLAPAIGRSRELATLTTLLQTQRLLTVCGPAGIGKTRLALALAWAQRPAWRDGVWFVELASLVADGSPDAALAATLRAAVVQALQLDAAAGSRTDALARALQPLQLLLVLDNAEHLLAALAPWLEALLAQAPTLHVIVTSQEPLHLAGEQLLRLQPLTLPVPGDDDDADRLMACGAVQLFVARVSARLPGFSLGPHQRQAVAQICRQLDGLPLALELAAARVPVLGVHGIADLLQAGTDRLQLLTQGTRTAAPRQRTLRAALAWSHDLLDERQRCVLRRLAVFRGGFALAQAQAVCSEGTLSPWAVLDAVQALVDKSLLSTPADGVGVAAVAPLAQPRLQMPESVRAFAHEQLLLAGEADRIAARHAATVAAYWAQADAGALGMPALPWLDLHGGEIDNLRAALRWARDAGPQPAPAHAGPQGGVQGSQQAALPLLRQLVADSALLWHRAGLYAEGRDWCNAACGAEPAPDPGLDLALATLGLYGHIYLAPEILASAQRAAAGFAASGDTQRQYYALYLVYQMRLRASVQTEPALQAALLAQMQALEQPGWPELLTRFARALQGYEHRRGGRPADYLAYCQDELSRCQRLGAVAEGWPPAQGLMLAEHDRGELGAALEVGRQALADIRRHGRLRQHGALHALWTTMLAQGGDCAGARQALAETLPMLHGAGTAWMAGVALAWLAAQESRPAVAAQLLGRHRAAQQAQQRAADGGTVARAWQALHTRLQAELGGDDLARQQRLGAMLDDAAAERLALAKPR